MHARCRKEVVEYIIHDLHWNHYFPHIIGQNEFLLEPTGSVTRKGQGESSQVSDSHLNEDERSEAWKIAYRNYMLRDSIYFFYELCPAPSLEGNTPYGP